MQSIRTGQPGWSGSVNTKKHASKWQQQRTPKKITSNTNVSDAEMSFLNLLTHIHMQLYVFYVRHTLNSITVRNEQVLRRQNGIASCLDIF